MSVFKWSLWRWYAVAYFLAMAFSSLRQKAYTVLPMIFIGAVICYFLIRSCDIAKNAAPYATLYLPDGSALSSRELMWTFRDNETEGRARYVGQTVTLRFPAVRIARNGEIDTGFEATVRANAFVGKTALRRGDFLQVTGPITELQYGYYYVDPVSLEKIEPPER